MPSKSLEIVSRPAPAQTDYATREWVEKIVDQRIYRSLKLSEDTTNKIVCGFSTRLFKQFPKAIAAAIMEANPNLAIDADSLTAALESIFQPQLNRA